LELFKFLPTPEPTSFEQGRMINGAKSIMWAERYRDPGEFEILAPLSSDLMNFLPLGSLVSHVDTYEVMVVENQEITEASDGDPSIKITGRSLESYFENRIVGMVQVRGNSTIVEYPIAAVPTWEQLTSLIMDHIQNPAFQDDMLPNVVAVHNVTGPGTSEYRTLKRMPLSQAVLEILAIDDLGIKTIRRNPFGTPSGSNIYTNIVIYRGVDRTASVVFSWKAGDLTSIDYLFSDKKLKNSAMIVGRYINTVYDTAGATKYNRRSVIVDGGDIDGIYNAPPTGAQLTDVINKMQVRGKQELDSQNRVTITRADLADISKYQYRKDFDVGDLISLDSNYGKISVMRIVEYVEIMDENGETGHPTLSIPGV
jgi:hypothetical protein